MLFINGEWKTAGGEEFISEDPATGEAVWSGREATVEDVDAAIQSARRALPAWSGLSLAERVEVLERFSEQLQQNRDRLAQVISLEVGKPRWEALGEVETMIAKIPVSVQALTERRREQQIPLGGARGVTRFKPHGVLGVFGPFNFPGHVANGHIVPALLAGNTLVFKPSELTPLTAEETVRMWEGAGLPAGVLNLVQGGKETGIPLVENPGHDGILFTGSLNTGIAIRQALVDRPETILALELGGNNPLLVHEVADVEAAVYWTIHSAYATAGQRCTCTRRLIVTEGNEAFLNRLAETIPRIRVGPPGGDPEPFCGPLINTDAVDRVLREQRRLEGDGARPIVHADKLAYGPAFVSPGLIDVTDCVHRDDTEVFGPLLQLVRVQDLEAAIEEANDTQYGLVAALFSDRSEHFETFFRHVRAGLVNWNRPTTGASGKLPFGGVGRSGNHRPAGYFAADYCNFPVGSLEADSLTLPEALSPGISLTAGAASSPSGE